MHDGDTGKGSKSISYETSYRIENLAAACDVFPDTGDNIGAGTNTARSLAAGTGVTYASFSGSNWDQV